MEGKLSPEEQSQPTQVELAYGNRSVTGTLPPSAATRNGIETVVSISSSSSRTGPPSLRRPKIDEKMSPNPPNELRSERSKSLLSKGRPPPAPAPAYAP